ncbi:MAG TPA: Ig domain-containing protein [Nitrospira sp.]
MMSMGHDERAWENTLRALSSRMVAIALPATFLIFSGCLSSEHSETTGGASGVDNHPPVIQAVTILPHPLTLSGPLTVMVEAQDLDSNTVSFRYRWLVNGQVVAGQTTESFPPNLLKREDLVVVEVVPYDGMIEGVPFRSASASVVNTAPILSSVSVDFDQAEQGRRVIAKAEVFDPDHDSVSLAYRWRSNGNVVKEGESNTLDLSGLTAKDAIEVDVIASDGTPDGISTLSGQFALSNSSPAIVSKPVLSPDGEAFDYLVKATDPDGDPISYALEVAPQGMTIDANTGQIHWGVTAGAKGSYRVRVVVTDSQGGFAAQEFDLAVNTAKES